MKVMVSYSIGRVNGGKARIVGQGDPKTRDRPASKTGSTPERWHFIRVAAVLGEYMHTPMTPGPKAS